MKTKHTTFLFTAIVSTLLIILVGCSSGIEQNVTSDQTSFSGDKSFSFKENGSAWKVDFEDDDITAIYKDGSRLPDSDIENYREMIFDKIDELKSEQAELSGNVYRFNFDVDKLKDHIDKFKNDFDNDKFMHFKLEFDEDEFENCMRDLEDNLKELKDKKIELYFNSEKFKENMKELEENLKDLPVHPDIDIDVHLDMDKFQETMKNIGKEFKLHNLRIDSSVIDMKNLRESMKELKKNMGGLRIEMHDLKGEMKKLNEFLDDLKAELVKDGYINSTDEEFNLEIDKDKTEVNGNNVKQADHLKYKELYKKHFDKELDGTFKISRD